MSKDNHHHSLAQTSATIYLASLSCLGLLLVVGLLQYSYPRNAEKLGALAKYSIQGDPYFIDSRDPLVLVNTGEEVLVFAANAPRHTHCKVRWDSLRGNLFDPCLGTRFDLQGAYAGGGPPQDLIRYPVEIIDGEIWVELPES